MKAIIYMIMVFIGVVLSYPVTIILIAIEQAMENKDHIKKWLGK